MSLKTKRSQEGYLLIDHRAGEGTQQVPGGVTFETPTITCAHCHTVVVLNPLRTRERGYCRKCDAYVCDKPECNAECTPMNKIMDEIQETRARGRRLSPGGIILPGGETIY